VILVEKWKETEEVIALIEKVISPTSKIETNVFLPDLNSTTGAKRQCDIVIKSGVSPRDTISIVEVQDRASKVEVNIFDGWYQKMRDVGAQHLICVSKKGFPRSVIEKAERIGPTVRLITLTELASHSWPFDFISGVVSNPRRELISINNAELHYKNECNTNEEGLDISMDDKCFAYNNLSLSAKELYFTYMDYHEGLSGELKDGQNTISVNLPLEGDEMRVKVNGEFKDVISFTSTIEVYVENRKFELVCNEYKQITYAGSLAWLMEATVFKNDEEAALKLILAPDHDRGYRLIARLFA
jgi:hypothetical protein